VTKDLTDLGQRGAGTQHGGGSGVPEPMSMDLAEAGTLAGVEDDHRHPAGGQRPMRGMHPDEHGATFRGGWPAGAGCAASRSR